MKTLKLLQLSVLSLLLIVFAGCCNVDSKTEVTSEIVEVKPDYSNMPPYCDPKDYKIIKTTKGYTIQMSGGTIIGDYYKTPERAQREINKLAENSKQRFIDSGGLDF